MFALSNNNDGAFSSNVSGLIKLVGIEMANKMIRRAFNGKGDKIECKLRRGIKVVFYSK